MTEKPNVTVIPAPPGFHRINKFDGVSESGERRFFKNPVIAFAVEIRGELIYATPIEASGIPSCNSDPSYIGLEFPDGRVEAGDYTYEYLKQFERAEGRIV